MKKRLIRNYGDKSRSKTRMKKKRREKKTNEHDGEI
jgi:hypothetical protein